MKKTGAAIVAAVLKEHSVDTVFGYPGGNVLSLYEAFAHLRGLRHILTASEAGAAHAADGYARVSGRTGVCVATSGPGATNLVTGVATAYMDSSPVVFITGNVPVSQIGSDSFQEVDITGITEPITKHNVMVKDITALADALRFAFFTAREGRPGPVLVDIPADIQRAECEYKPQPPREVTPSRPAPLALEEAARLISGAVNPVILAGGGCVDASAELAAFAEKLGCPVAATLMGLGVFPASHSLYAGMAGIYGTPTARDALEASDLIIAIGTRFSDRLAQTSRGTARSVLHIDIDRSEINKNVRTSAFVAADAALTLAALSQMITACNPVSVTRTAAPNAPPREIVSHIRAAFGDALIATDVGKHQMWAAQSISFERPRSLITPGGMGTMGFGLGAAIGACIAAKRRVVLVTGDGSFMMNQNELMTAVRERLPITVIVMRNGELDMVREQQRELGYNNATALPALPDFIRLAEAYGATALRVASAADAPRVFSEAAKLKTPVVIDCPIDADISSAQGGGVIEWEDEA